MLTNPAPTLNERATFAGGPLDLRQSRQCLDRGAEGLKLVMGVNNIHVGRSVPGELLAQLLADTGVRQRAVKRVCTKSEARIAAIAFSSAHQLMQAVYILWYVWDIGPDRLPPKTT